MDVRLNPALRPAFGGITASHFGAHAPPPLGREPLSCGALEDITIFGIRMVLQTFRQPLAPLPVEEPLHADWCGRSRMRRPTSRVPRHCGGAGRRFPFGHPHTCRASQADQIVSLAGHRVTEPEAAARSSHEESAVETRGIPERRALTASPPRKQVESHEPQRGGDPLDGAARISPILRRSAS
jgi:hypothetical protein